MHDILHNGAITLHHGDCLDVMHEIPDGSVDAIICDIPYGKTNCKWDVVIPFEPMWIHLKRIIKPRGAIVLFGSQPFTSALVMSNPKMFRYEWIWNKNNGANFASVKKMPLRVHENICVFYDKQPLYNAELKGGTIKSFGKRVFQDSVVSANNTGTKQGIGYPKSIVSFPKPNNLSGGGLHPTQKPVALLEYLIRTYTNEGETVLDFTFGSCSAGVAALTTKRRFIGIERDATYYALGVQRVQTAIDNLPPMDV